MVKNYFFMLGNTELSVFLACVTVALQILTKGEMKDDWFQLRASHSRTEAGTVRIKARYMVRQYSDFNM